MNTKMIKYVPQNRLTVILFAMLFGLLSYPVAGSEKTINLKLSSFFTPNHPSVKIVNELIQEVSEISNGRVAIKHYGSSSLGSPSEQLDITIEGLADMAVTCNSYTPARFPLSLVAQLPLFSDSAKTGTMVVMELEKRGYFDSEYEEVFYMYPAVTTPSRVFSTKKISSISDFKGLRMVGGELIFRDISNVLGANVYYVEMPEVYLALQRKTVDAAINSWMISMAAYKWHEVTKYVLDMPILSGWHCNVVMNKSSWQKVPSDVQQSWKKIFPKYAMKGAMVFDYLDGVMKKRWSQVPGVQLNTLSEADQKKFEQMVTPIWQKWVERNGKKGEQIYRAYVGIMKNMGKPVRIKLPGLYQN